MRANKSVSAQPAVGRKVLVFFGLCQKKLPVGSFVSQQPIEQGTIRITYSGRQLDYSRMIHTICNIDVTMMDGFENRIFDCILAVAVFGSDAQCCMHAPWQ